jgi:hypothetical protein
MAKAKTAGTARKSAPARKPSRPAAAERTEPRKVKEIAGVKVPKDLREVAAAAQKLMENPLVRDVVTAGVLAAMAAFAESQQKKNPGAVGDAAEAAGRNSKGLKATAKVVAGAAAGAMGKKLMDEVKARGPELVAKLDTSKSGGANGGGETRLGSRRERDERERREQEETEEA